MPLHALNVVPFTSVANKLVADETQSDSSNKR